MHRQFSAQIMIRPAYADDYEALAHVAALDSAVEVPPRPLLVAEVDGVLRAALSLRDGSSIADPFFASAPLLELLRAHSAGAGAGAKARGWRWGHRLGYAHA